jgi:hypothetical protein
MGTVDKPWDPFVLAFVVVCLILGLLLKVGVENRTTGFVDPSLGISLHYPASWVTTQEENAHLAVFNPHTPSIFNTKFTLRSVDWYENLEIGNFIMELAAERGTAFTLYRTISMKPIQLNNRKGMQIEYAYATDPIGVHAGVVSIPKIVRALDVIVPDENMIHILTFAAEENQYERNLPHFYRILKSVSIQQGGNP